MYAIRLRINDESFPYYFGGLSNGTFWLTDEVSHALLFPCRASVYSMLSVIDSITYNLELHYAEPICIDLEHFDVDDSVFFNYSYEIN